jgi:hypothetical protein
MGSQGHENLKPFQPKFQPKRLEEPLEALIIIILEYESFLPYVKALRPLCGGDMYGAFEISTHLFLSSLSFGECKHKVLVAIVFFMAIQHVRLPIARFLKCTSHENFMNQISHSGTGYFCNASTVPSFSALPATL